MINYIKFGSILLVISIIIFGGLIILNSESKYKNNFGPCCPEEVNYCSDTFYDVWKDICVIGIGITKIEYSGEEMRKNKGYIEDK